MLSVTITTSRPLSNSIFTTIKKAVNNKYGADVEFVKIIDEKVVGGISLMIGSKEIDLTVKGKLREIEKKLLAS